MKKILFLVLVTCVYTAVYADTKWELKKDNNGIRVYTGEITTSNLKAVKVTCTLDAGISQLVALLLDVKAHEQWVYNTKTSYLVKQLGPGHLVYYSEISMPWPLANRDVVSELTISQDPVSKILHITANNAENYVPKNEGKVRVPLSKVSWVVTPLSTGQVSVEYIGEANPGGEIPAWLVNSFSTKGPFETFKKLKELVTSSVYKNIPNAFVKD